ncbi:MAG: aminopeptidase PepB [Pseudomonadota bacterium]
MSLQVRLTRDKAGPPWPENVLLSADAAGFVVHLHASDPDRALRAAGRRIRGQGIAHVALTGAWPLASQWSFSRGFLDARGGEITWAELPESERCELDDRLAAFEWSRAVANATPEELAPRDLADRAATFLARCSENARATVIEGEALPAAGHHGIWQVGRGSDRPPVLLEVDYNPGDDDAPVAAALVGKGITFDSGGYSIKASEAMFSMKFDMAGAATVAAALGLAIRRGLRRRVKLFLCCAENLISGHAYKLGDIIEYRNGVRVEIANTDAEGRLVLADGLMSAGESGAPLIIDAATLTGAAHNAVGAEYNAVFCRDPVLRGRFLELAEDCGERHWPLPLDDFHRSACPSPYADTMNSRPVKGGGPAGASNAAAFLSRFVPDEGRTGWVHVDLSAAFAAKASGTTPAGATGHGILTIASALMNLGKEQEA